MNKQENEKLFDDYIKYGFVAIINGERIDPKDVFILDDKPIEKAQINCIEKVLDDA